MVYPALLPLMPHTSAASSRLNWRPPADLNRIVRLAERRNLVSARVPSHFKRSLIPYRRFAQPTGPILRVQNYTYYYYYCYYTIWMSLVTGLFFPVLLLNQRWSLLLTLQASHCSTFRIMCDVPSIAVFCNESIECFPGTVSKFFFKLYYYYYYYYYYCVWVFSVCQYYFQILKFWRYPFLCSLRLCFYTAIKIQGLIYMRRHPA